MLVCSCGHYQRKRRSCRHIRCFVYADLGHGDFGIRNTKLYEAYYGWLDKFTKQADEMLEREGKGPTVAMPLSLNYANEDSTMSWFQQALNQIVMRPMREVIVIPSQSTQAFETVTNMPEDDDFPFGGGEDEDEVDDEAGQPVAVPWCVRMWIDVRTIEVRTSPVYRITSVTRSNALHTRKPFPNDLWVSKFAYAPVSKGVLNLLNIVR